MSGHTCTCHSVYTREQVLRAVAVLRRNWRKIQSKTIYNDECGHALCALASCKDYSSPTDLAHFSIRRVRDWRVLWDAIEEAIPKAKRTLEVIEDALEAMSCAYWNGHAECDDKEDCPYQYSDQAAA